MKSQIILLILLYLILFSACSEKIIADETILPEPGVDKEESHLVSQPESSEVVELYELCNWDEAARAPYHDGWVCFDPFYGVAIFNKDGEIIKWHHSTEYFDFEYNYEFSQVGSYSKDYLDLYVYGDQLMFVCGRDWNETVNISLLDGTLETISVKGKMLMDNAAVFADFEYDSDEIPTEMWIELWLDGKLSRRYIIPKELLPGIPIYPDDAEYKPDDGILIIYSPAFKYYIDLDSGAVTRENNFPIKPELLQSILASSEDGVYYISSITGGWFGDMLYSINNETGETRDYGVVHSANINMFDHTMILSSRDAVNFYDLDTGELLPINLPVEENITLSIVYYKGDNCFLRAVAPGGEVMRGYSSPPEYIRVDYFTRDGKLIRSVQTPFEIDYGKYNSTSDINLTVYKGKALMYEYMSFRDGRTAPIKSIGCMDIATGECTNLSGNIFYVLGDYLFTLEEQKKSTYYGPATIRQYNGDVLVKEKLIEYEEFPYADYFSFHHYSPETGLIEGIKGFDREPFTVDFN